MTRCLLPTVSFQPAPTCCLVEASSPAIVTIQRCLYQPHIGCLSGQHHPTTYFAGRVEMGDVYCDEEKVGENLIATFF